MIKVIKVGGNIVDDEAALLKFCNDFASMQGPKVLVHGGGVSASVIQEALGQKVQKIEGRRVTDADTLKVVTMVYSGWCNKHITALLQARGCNAIGLSGCDGAAITASRRAPRTLSDGITVVDYGFVGDVTPGSVNVPFLKMLMEKGMVPVLCAINHDGHGQLLNTNADTVAAGVAAALKGELVCCFELDGVLSGSGTLINSLDTAECRKMIAEGVISGGMIPKVENCLKALEDGAAAALVTNASNLLNGKGTRIVL